MLGVMPGCPVIESAPEILGGTPVFVGTRVPVATFFDYLEGGQPLADFLDDLATVRHEQAIQLLEHLKQLAVNGASPPR